MSKIKSFLMLVIMSTTASVALGYQENLKTSICNDGLDCWVQLCPYDPNIDTPIEQRRIRFIEEGYVVSAIKTSSYDKNYCGFEYYRPKANSNQQVACQREILSGALSERIKAVPQAESLLTQSFSIEKADFSQDPRLPSVVAVKMVNLQDGSTITVDYSVKISSQSSCKVKATLIAD